MCLHWQKHQYLLWKVSTYILKRIANDTITEIWGKPLRWMIFVFSIVEHTFKWLNSSPKLHLSFTKYSQFCSCIFPWNIVFTYFHISKQELGIAREVHHYVHSAFVSNYFILKQIVFELCHTSRFLFIIIIWLRKLMTLLYTTNHTKNRMFLVSNKNKL